MKSPDQSITVKTSNFPSPSSFTRPSVPSEIHRLRQAIEQIRLAGESMLNSRKLTSKTKERVSRFLQFVYEVADEIRDVEKGTLRDDLSTLPTAWAVELCLAASGVALEAISPSYHHLVKCFGEACLYFSKFTAKTEPTAEEAAKFQAAVDFVISEAFPDRSRHNDSVKVSLPAQLALQNAA